MEFQRNVDATFWAISKNLQSGKWKKVRHTNIFNVSHDENKYWPFLPQNEDDWEARHEYGIIENGSLVLIYILLMSENEEEVDEGIKEGARADGSRILNPKRRVTLTPAIIPLKRMEFTPGRDTSTSAKKSQKAAARKHKNTEQNASILNEYLKDKGKVAETNKEIQPNTVSSTVQQSQNELLESLRKENSELKALLLQQQQNERVTVQDVAVQICEQVKKEIGKVLPAAVAAHSSQTTGLKALVTPDVDPPEIKITSNISLTLSEVIDIERNQFKFTSKVNRLCDLIWQGEVHTYFVKPATTEARGIDPAIIDKFTEIILHMKVVKEERGVRVSKDTVKRQIEKYTAYRRRIFKLNKLSKEEKNKRKEDAKQKQLARKAEGTKYKIKKRKRVYLATSSSMKKGEKNKRSSSCSSSSTSETKSNDEDDVDQLAGHDISDMASDDGPPPNDDEQLIYYNEEKDLFETEFRHEEEERLFRNITVRRKKQKCISDDDETP